MKRTAVAGLAALALAIGMAIGPALVYAQSTISAILFLGSVASPTAVSSGAGVIDTGTVRTTVAQRQTYGGATTAKTATAAGTGPFFAICGSGTKTIRVQTIDIGGTVATAAVYGDVQIRKVSTTTSAGTPVALTKVPFDSANSAGTATVAYYTALATTGTNVGMVDTRSAVFPITGTVAAPEADVLFDWSMQQSAHAPVLRGTGDCLEASFGTTTTNAPTLTVSVRWTEE